MILFYSKSPRKSIPKSNFLFHYIHSPSKDTTKPSAVGIIPARYASSRFPGKPLALLDGKPMFWHVYTRAAQCRDLDAVWLATDDERILKRARELDVPAYRDIALALRSRQGASLAVQRFLDYLAYR